LPDKHESARTYARFSSAGSGLKGIIRSVGMPETVEFDQMLAVAAGSKEDRARYKIAQAISDKDKEAELIRRARECDLSG